MGTELEHEELRWERGAGALRKRLDFAPGPHMPFRAAHDAASFVALGASVIRCADYSGPSPVFRLLGAPHAVLSIADFASAVSGHEASPLVRRSRGVPPPEGAFRNPVTLFVGDLANDTGRPEYLIRLRDSWLAGPSFLPDLQHEVAGIRSDLRARFAEFFAAFPTVAGGRWADVIPPLTEYVCGVSPEAEVRS
jgi:hypothetical protein